MQQVKGLFLIVSSVGEDVAVGSSAEGLLEPSSLGGLCCSSSSSLSMGGWSPGWYGSGEEEGSSAVEVGSGVRVLARDDFCSSRSPHKQKSFVLTSWSWSLFLRRLVPVSLGVKDKGFPDLLRGVQSEEHLPVWIINYQPRTFPLR